jgi:hypothetical protein
LFFRSDVVDDGFCSNAVDDNKPAWLVVVFYTWEKNQVMTMSLSARRHLLHLRKKNKEMTMS